MYNNNIWTIILFSIIYIFCIFGWANFTLVPFPTKNPIFRNIIAENSMWCINANLLYKWKYTIFISENELKIHTIKLIRWVLESECVSVCTCIFLSCIWKCHSNQYHLFAAHYLRLRVTFTLLCASLKIVINCHRANVSFDHSLRFELVMLERLEIAAPQPSIFQLTKTKKMVFIAFSIPFLKPIHNHQPFNIKIELLTIRL